MIDEMEKLLKAAFDGTDVRVIRCDEDGMTEITAPKLADNTVPDYDFGDWTLCYAGTRDPMPYGEVCRTNEGELEYILTGGRPPHKPSSTGRVYVRDEDGEREFFPSVFGLKWYHKSEVLKS